MCTLILGVDVLEPPSVILAANRDEDPARPTDPPRELGAEPRVVGGRDARSGGTWLAVRGSRAAVALLNRRPAATTPATPRSRGLLTLDIAGSGADGDPAELAAAARVRLEHELESHAFAPFSMVFASPGASWIATHDPGSPLRIDRIEPGWHVVTHESLDDIREPRTRGLVADLASWRPRAVERAIEGLKERLALHAGDRAGVPDVCIHEGRMATVSASLVWLSPAGARYLHAEGRPCVTLWKDHTALLDRTIGEPAP